MLNSVLCFYCAVMTGYVFATFCRIVLLFEQHNMVGGVTYHENKCACPSETLMNLFRAISADRQNLNEPNRFENADKKYMLPVLNNMLFV